MLEEIYEIKAFGKHAALLSHLVTTVGFIVCVQRCVMKLCFFCQEINAFLVQFMLFCSKQASRGVRH